MWLAHVLRAPVPDVEAYLRAWLDEEA
jgi:hypothetical protein